jgi:hypothetical protein
MIFEFAFHAGNGLLVDINCEFPACAAKCGFQTSMLSSSFSHSGFGILNMPAAYGILLGVEV